VIECQLVWLDYTIEYRIEKDYSTTNHNKCISKVLIVVFQHENAWMIKGILFINIYSVWNSQ
jgi:hypothetical protein